MGNRQGEELGIFPENKASTCMYMQAVTVIKNTYDSKNNMQDSEKLLLIHIVVMMVGLEEINSYNTMNGNIFIRIMKLFVTE